MGVADNDYVYGYEYGYDVRGCVTSVLLGDCCVEWVRYIFLLNTIEKPTKLEMVYM